MERMLVADVREATRGVLRRWTTVAQRLGLTVGGRAAGAVVLAAELDNAVRERLAGDLSPNLCIRRGMVLATMNPHFGEETGLAALVELGQTGVLVGYGRDWLSAEVAIHERVRAACLWAPAPAPAAPFVSLCDRLENEVAAAVRACVHTPREAFVVVRGRSGSGRGAIVRRVLDELRLHSREVTVTELRSEVDRFEPALSGAAAVWVGAGEDVGPEDLRRAAEWLGRSTTLSMAVVDNGQHAPVPAVRRVVAIDADLRDGGERAVAWERALCAGGMEHAPRQRVATHLAARTRAGSGLIWRCATQAAKRDTADEIVRCASGLLLALSNSETRSGVVVERPTVTVEDLVLAKPARTAVERFMSLAVAPSASRAGVKALFSGASGTGKTMAARAVSASLGVPLFRVDLAGVVSKWVGETEKNLRGALDAAADAGALLLFDEGDALFSKRGEVQRGADRYANFEVSFLLQALELHDGLVIVTTNLQANIDNAFTRRFDVCAQFSMPDAASRAMLWRRELRGQLGADVEKQFGNVCEVGLSGGNIAAAARLALSFAHSRGEASVRASDVALAVASELEKLGAGAQAADWYKRG